MLIGKGYMQIRHSFANATYRLEWANPAWSWLELDPSSEILQVKSRLHEVLATLPHLDWYRDVDAVAERGKLLTVEASWSQFACDVVKEWWYEFKESKRIWGN